MKKIAFIALVSLTFLLGCKKDDEPVVDPRDQFVGTYSAEMVVSFPTIQYLESATGTNTITKEASSGRVKITSDAGDVMYATVTGNTYVYDKYSLTENWEGMTITMEQTGTGVINGTSIAESGTMKLYANGETITGTWTCTLVKK